MSKYQGTIEILARGLLVSHGQVLACRTAKAPILYLPGGHVEFEESAPVALAREIEEECGVPARVGTFLGVLEHTFVQKGERHCEINLVFALAADAIRPDAPVPVREAHLSFEWIPLERLASAPLEPAPLRTLIPGWLGENTRAFWASTYKG